MEEIQVKSKSGPIVGETYKGISSFKGIPFARAPIGELRFAPPQDIAPWTAPLKAFNYGPIAHQYFDSSDFLAPPARSYTLSEDCLSLNIWTKEAGNAEARLPVFIFIHGGGFAIGSSGQPMFGRFSFGKKLKSLYDGSFLAGQGIVVVTCNYRLGALGFLASNETLKRHGTTGNWGLLDQLKAIEWVKNNIEAFGGDPTEITVGGESAGSMSVSALIVSPLAKGLFQRAILQSGTIFSFPQVPVARGDLTKGIKVGNIMLSLMGLEDNEEGFLALQKVPAGTLAKLSALNMNFTKLSPFAMFPVADGYVIPFNPLEKMAQGEFNQVPLLLGTNGDEGSIFIPEKADIRELESSEITFLGSKALKFFLELSGLSGLKPYERTRKAIAYAVFTAGTKRLADLYSKYQNTYVYNFNYSSIPARMLGLGPHHAAELPFIFNTLPKLSLVWGFHAKKLSKEIQLRWVSFIKTGIPNPPEVEPRALWPVYDAKAPRVLILDKLVVRGKYPDEASLNTMADAFFGKL
ncbi:MAG: carboxylesterase family protein [Deltaproteobacteria bacterium]|jgi:para-nitrobenzyl esterase|nr:carboxylesterase family protein [Deltaproteobacteria bacterium]